MTKAGKIILSVIGLVAASTAITVGIGTISETFSPWRVYACDFRLISAATCNLPMAAHTTRMTVTAAEADRMRRVAHRERIISCEHERTIQRQSGEPEPASKCWDESRW